MQVSVESTGNLGRKMKVQVPAERIDREVEERLKSMSRRVKVDGFRPGKVPLKVVKQRYGGAVVQEVIGEVMRASFHDAVAQENLRPAGGPNIEPQAMGAGRDLEYTATFDVYPELRLAPVEDFTITRPVVEVTDEDIDRMIQRLRQQRATWEPVERAAQNGDQLMIDLDGRAEGEPFEGGQAEDMKIELGDDRLIAGFEEQLTGARAGEDRTLELIFPEDYPQAELAGKPAVFEVKVKQVAEPHLPEMDEGFVRALGVGEGGVEALRQAARANMERELRQRIDNRLKNQIMDALCEANPAELPEALVKREIAHLREQAMQSTGQTDTAHFPDELFDNEARRRVALGIIIGEIVNQQEIKVESAELQQALTAMTAGYEDPQQMMDYYRQNAQAMAQVETLVLERKIVDWVTRQAKVVEEPMSFDALMNPKPVEDVNE